MRSFAESLRVSFYGNAQYFAAELFVESFRVPFPVPRENAGLAIATPPENWRQEVAFYKKPLVDRVVPPGVGHRPGADIRVRRVAGGVDHARASGEAMTKLVALKPGCKAVPRRAMKSRMILKNPRWGPNRGWVNGSTP